MRETPLRGSVPGITPSNWSSTGDDSKWIRLQASDGIPCWYNGWPRADIPGMSLEALNAMLKV